MWVLLAVESLGSLHEHEQALEAFWVEVLAFQGLGCFFLSQTRGRCIGAAAGLVALLGGICQEKIRKLNIKVIII